MQGHRLRAEAAAVAAALEVSKRWARALEPLKGWLIDLKTGPKGRLPPQGTR